MSYEHRKDRDRKESGCCWCCLLQCASSDLSRQSLLPSQSQFRGMHWSTVLHLNSLLGQAFTVYRQYNTIQYIHIDSFICILFINCKYMEIALLFIFDLLQSVFISSEPSAQSFSWSQRHLFGMQLPLEQRKWSDEQVASGKSKTVQSKHVKSSVLLSIHMHVTASGCLWTLPWTRIKNKSQQNHQVST